MFTSKFRNALIVHKLASVHMHPYHSWTSLVCCYTSGSVNSEKWYVVIPLGLSIQKNDVNIKSTLPIPIQTIFNIQYSADQMQKMG